MALLYGSGNYQNDTLTFGADATTNRKNLVNKLKDLCVANGQWAASPIRAKSTFTWTNQPANSSTITFDGKTYTFQTTLTNVDGNVQIGANLAASIANLVAAITLGAGAGTAYAAATTAHPTCTVLLSTATTVTVVQNDSTDPFARYGQTCTNTGTINGSWDGNMPVAGWILLSAEDPTFQRFAIAAFAREDDTLCEFVVLSRDASENAASQSVYAASATPTKASTDGYSRISTFTNGIVYLFIVTGQTVFFTRPNDVTNDHNFFLLNISRIPTQLGAKKITGATNASPIVITTSAAHGYTTGQQVTVAYVTGNTAANGTWTITVTSATQFSLNGSVGNGTFGGTSPVCWNVTLKHIGESFIHAGCANSGNTSTLRNGWYHGAITSCVYFYNGAFYVKGTNTGLGFLGPPAGGAGVSLITWADDSYLLQEAWITSSTGAASGTTKVTGQAADMAFVSSRGAPVDTIVSSLDGKDWRVINNQQSNTILIRNSA